MNPDFDQIKRTTDIIRVVESYGVKLKRTGRNYVGRCCFHDDKNPSLIVTPDKGLFHCPGCGAAGNVIQFVARKEGISDREAALKLVSTGESPRDQKLDVAEHAAYTAMLNMILNLDEVITKE